VTGPALPEPSALAFAKPARRVLSTVGFTEERVVGHRRRGHRAALAPSALEDWVAARLLTRCA
jgi:hypothetical protein